MKKSNACMIAIICFMMLFLLHGIAAAQELLIQPKPAEPTATVPVETDRKPTFEFLGMYYNDNLLSTAGMQNVSSNVWYKKIDDATEVYVYLDNSYRAIISSYNFSDYYNNFSFEDVVNRITTSIDKGFVERFVTCYDNKSDVCKSVSQSIGDYFPIVVLTTVRSDVLCLAYQMPALTTYEEDTYSYTCVLTK